MAYAPVDPDRYQLLRDPQGTVRAVPSRDVDRLIRQEGWQPPPADSAPTSVYERLLQEDAERSRFRTPQPVLPIPGGPPSHLGGPIVPGAPDVAGGGVTTVGPGEVGRWGIDASGRPVTDLAISMRADQEEAEILEEERRRTAGPDRALSPVIPGLVPRPATEPAPAPTPSPAPTPEVHEGFPRIFPDGTVPRVHTEQLPDGSVRLLPHISQPFTTNERATIEGYMSAFTPGPEITATGRTPAAEAAGGAVDASRYYQPWGEFVQRGDERLRPGEEPYFLLPDGSRTTQLPSGWAYQPSTGRIFVSRTGTDFRGVESLGGAIARSVGTTLTEPFHDFGRGIERLERGMIVPDTQMFMEAVNVQGLLALGTGGIRFGAGRVGSEAPPIFGRPHTPTPEVPPARPRATLEISDPNTLGQIEGRIVNAAGEDAGGFYARRVRTSANDPGFTQIGNIEIRGGMQRQGVYKAIRDHLEATTGRPHVPDSTLSNAAYSWWLREDPEAVRGLYTRMGDSHWQRRMLAPSVVETARTRAVRDAFHRKELRSPLLEEGRRRRGNRVRNFRLMANPDEPAPGIAAITIGGHRITNIEADPAGFHVRALEVARHSIPDRAPVREVRRILRDEGVSDAEIRALKLDDLLLGPVGPARRALTDAQQVQSRAANEYGRTLRLIRNEPGNMAHRNRAAQQLAEIRVGASVLRGAIRDATIAERAHIVDARRARLSAEATLKDVNRRIRIAVAEGRPPGNMYAERAEARQLIRDAEAGLRAASAGGPDERLISAREVINHIRANRPVLETFVRRYPENSTGVYGDLSEPIGHLRRGRTLSNALRAEGVPMVVADYVGTQLREQAPHHWPVVIAAAANRVPLRPGIVRETIERVAGATVNDMVRAAKARAPDAPRYRWAVPDQDNPTLVETAITLRGVHSFASTHWGQNVSNPVAHMQTSIQRLPRRSSEKGVTDKTHKKIEELSSEQLRLGIRLENDLNISTDEWTTLHRRFADIERQIERLETKVKDSGPSEHRIYLGNQFQSDWAMEMAKATGLTRGHPLVENVRMWVRPILEAYVDQGIKSEIGRIGVPDGATVMRYNPMMEGTSKLYDNIIRPELDGVLKRRGIEPVSRQDIDRIYPMNDNYGNPAGYVGRWHVIELPRSARPGARIYSNPDDLTAGVAGVTISNISRGPGFSPELMRRRGGQSLVRRIRDVQPTETELRHWPRAERVEMLEIGDPHPGPVIGYHATRADFTTFNLALSRDIGHHFGTRQQAMNRVQGGKESGVRIIPAYLDVRMPLELPDLGFWDTQDVVHQILSRVPDRHKDAAANLADTVSHLTDRTEQFVAIRDALTRMGYDAIRYRNIVEGTGYTYIVWTPGLVRSVTDPTHQLYQGGVLVPQPRESRNGQEQTEPARRPRNRSSR